MHSAVLLLVFSLCLVGCASKDALPLQTEEFFTSRVNDVGKTQFAFGLAWQMEQGMRQAPDENYVRHTAAADSPPFRGGDRDARPPRLDKQSKLQLEDQAAEKLQAQIANRALCENGHKVEQVIWEVGRIRLMGHCL